VFKEAQDLPSKNFFAYERLNATSSQDSYRQATDEEEIFSSIRNPEAALQVQGTYSDESNVTLRPAYHEHDEDSLRWAEGQRMQANQATRATTCSLHANQGQSLRRSCQDAQHGDQNNHRKRYYVELSRLARKRDPRRFFDARDCCA
jgi:hypothetical protein